MQQKLVAERKSFLIWSVFNYSKSIQRQFLQILLKISGRSEILLPLASIIVGYRSQLYLVEAIANLLYTLIWDLHLISSIKTTNKNERIIIMRCVFVNLKPFFLVAFIIYLIQTIATSWKRLLQNISSNSVFWDWFVVPRK